ncbi:MAG: alpha-mannosidase, partial [Christensenellales bacterium]
MITENGMNQTKNKLTRFIGTLKSLMFRPVGSIETTLYQTKQPLNEIPDARLFKPADSPAWGGDGVYGWFKGEYTVPAELDGKAIFLWPRMKFYEATLWVNGKIHSNYAAKFVEGSHGNHYCNRITPCAKAGEKFDFALEGYAYHDMPGTQPLSDDGKVDEFEYAVGGMDICLRDDEVMDFMFDLDTLLSLCRALDASSFRRAEVENALYNAHLKLFYDPAMCTDEEFRSGLRAAAPILKQQLARKNGDATPLVGLIGHSHMDTAWLWPISETNKKCARTYANQLNLMAEYPEYRFVQSSAYHSDIIRRQYPELFSRIQKAVAEGRYEPNGGVWVECDCNLT